MHKREMTGTGLMLTELGFGAAGLGNVYVVIPDDVVSATVDAACRYFDTAPHYGLGLSERRLGAALRHHPHEDFVVSTKVGRLLEPNLQPLSRDDDLFEVPGDVRRRWDFSRDGILRSVEASLARLGLDRIDVAYLHDPDVSGMADTAQSGAAALLKLRDQGVVSAIGIGANDADAVIELLAATDIDTAMVAGRSTLLDHATADRILEAAGEHRIVAAAVFISGLSARSRPANDVRFDYAPAEGPVGARANRIADLLEEADATLPQAALAFPLRYPGVASCVVGMTSPGQVHDNVALASLEVDSKAWVALSTQGLIA